jgi:hypothetical protein
VDLLKEWKLAYAQMARYKSQAMPEADRVSLDRDSFLRRVPAEVNEIGKGLIMCLDVLFEPLRHQHG